MQEAVKGKEAAGGCQPSKTDGHHGVLMSLGTQDMWMVLFKPPFREQKADVLFTD